MSTGWSQEAAAIPNPGFEEGTQNWVTSKEDAAASLSQVVPDAAHTGQSGLRVKQEATGPGSWIQSSKIPIEAGKNYQLDFWARCNDTSGIGVFLQYYNSDGKNIPLSAQQLLQISASTKEWTEYRMDLKPPEGTASFTLAIHAFSKQPCNADFDDFSVVLSTGAAASTSTPSPTPVATTTAPAPTPLPAIDPARVKEIAGFLDQAPKGIGPLIDNRAPWEALAADTAFHDVLMPRAERFLNEPTPEISNEQWMESCRTSDRKAEPLIDRRRFRMITMILAEGMENKGRFLPAIEKEITAICSEPTWVLPAHDKQMLNYNGTQKMIDLGAGMTGWTLATADSMLGNHLSEATRKLIRDTTRERVIEPYLAESQGQTHIEWWRTNNFNWNAVVHGGVVGTALALDDSVEERAEIIASVEKEIPFYLEGFPKDGYSTEGMGYWKYGFGHFIMLSEAILNATHGKVNLYANDQARLVAQFPRRFEIVPNVYPAFADSAYLEEPATWLYHIINNRYGLGDDVPKTLTVDGMYSALLYGNATNLTFDSSAPPLFTGTSKATQGHRLRDWFEDGQVLIGRLPEGKTGLNFAIKGGNNGTSHGHNDLGSLVIVSGKQPLVVDPGSTLYGSTTFSSQRYENEILNSYGHSVPKVAGQLQMRGEQYAVTVDATSFTDAADSLTLDLTKGYSVPDLKKLTRRLDYTRADKGTVTVTDQVEFAAPQAFGTALVTYGEAKEEKPGIWTITQNGETVRVEISAGGLPFTVTNEVLKDESRVGKVNRLGIDLKSPAAAAAIMMKVTPVT